MLANFTWHEQYMLANSDKVVVNLLTEAHNSDI